MGKYDTSVLDDDAPRLIGMTYGQIVKNMGKITESLAKVTHDVRLGYEKP